MQYIDYCPPPVEPDLSECGVLKDYCLHCDGYDQAWNLMQYLKTFYNCDFSPPIDDMTLINGVPYSDWIIFFTCRPTDALRLQYVANRRYPCMCNVEGYC